MFKAAAVIDFEQRWLVRTKDQININIPEMCMDRTNLEGHIEWDGVEISLREMI